MGKVIGTTLTMIDHLTQPLKRARQGFYDTDKARKKMQDGLNVASKMNQSVGASIKTLSEDLNALGKAKRKIVKPTNTAKKAQEAYNLALVDYKKKMNAAKTSIDLQKAKINQLEEAQKRLVKPVKEAGQSQEDYNKKLSEYKRLLSHTKTEIDDERAALSRLKLEQAGIKKPVNEAKTAQASYNKALKEYKRRLREVNGSMLEKKKQLEKLKSATKAAQDRVRSFTQTMSSRLKSSLVTSTKLLAAMAVTFSAFSAKIGFSEAFDFEGYRAKLETAVKDTNKAMVIMQNMVKKANATPYEAGELIDVASRLEMMGMASKRWIDTVINSAGSLGKSSVQVTEAIIDAQVGEWERLKELGIRKDQIMMESAKRYGEKTVFNAKGQMLDQAKAMNVLQDMMDKRFVGGAQKQASTLKGLWSTLTGNFKLNMTKIVGINEDGSIRMGSTYAQLKTEIKNVIDLIMAWQKDGTIDRMAKRTDEFVKNTISGLKTAFNWWQKNKDAIVGIGEIIASVFVATKIVTFADEAIWSVKMLTDAIKVMATAQSGFNIMAAANPYLIAVAAIASSLYMIWKHWDKVKASISSTMNEMKKHDIHESMVTPLNDKVALRKQNDRYSAWQKHFEDPSNRGYTKADVQDKQAARYEDYAALASGWQDSVKDMIAATDKNTAELGRANDKDLKGGSYVLGGYIGYEAFDYKDKYKDLRPKGETAKVVEHQTHVHMTIEGNVIGNEEFVDDVATNIARKVVRVAKNK